MAFGEIEYLLNDKHQKGKMMIMIMKSSGSQVDSPVAEGKRKEGGGRKMRDSRTARFTRYADERTVGCVYHRRVLFNEEPNHM